MRAQQCRSSTNENAGHLSSSQGLGAGDSGGPLTYKKGLQHTLIGIGSWVREWTEGPCTVKFSEFSSVSYYRDWIDNNMEVFSCEFCRDEI